MPTELDLPLIQQPLYVYSSSIRWSRGVHAQDGTADEPLHIATIAVESGLAVPRYYPAIS